MYLDEARLGTSGGCNDERNSTVNIIMGKTVVEWCRHVIARRSGAEATGGLVAGVHRRIGEDAGFGFRVKDS